MIAERLELETLADVLLLFSQGLHSHRGKKIAV